jgi:hypothetical protein
MNSDFNAVQLQTIMESIQRMAPKGSPLVALAQQGAKAVNYVIAERSAGNHRREPSIGNQSNDGARQAQSEAASSAHSNRRLANNDARQRITQNHHLRETGHDRCDFHNIIEDRRRLRARSSTPP